MALRLRRGSDAERQSITPLEGELIYTTDTKELYVGDGSTQGGVLVSGNLSDDTSPSLSGNLDLNNNDITGTGNINIDGTITATGNINLGDGAEDNVIVGGAIGSSLIPNQTNTYNLGDAGGRWNSVNARSITVEGATVDGEINVGSIVTDGNIVKSDSTVVYDGASGALAVNSITCDTISIGSGYWNGDVSGSVFADDSTLLVDGVSGALSNGNLTLEDYTISFKDPTSDVLICNTQKITLNSPNDIAQSVYPALRLQSYRGTDSNKQFVQANDILGTLSVAGYTGVEDYADGGVILFGAANAPISQGDTTIASYTVIGSAANIAVENEKYLFISEEGHTAAPVFQTGTYDDEAARDAAIPNPVAGMIILLAGHDDSTGGPVFQGYDGTAWRDFT